jgi:hypothetical protein
VQEVKIGKDLEDSGENAFVGGENRWKYVLDHTFSDLILASEHEIRGQILDITCDEVVDV